MSLKIIHTKKLRWLDIVNPGADEIEFLKREFSFHSLDFESILTTSEHSRIENRGDYHCIVMLFPVYDRKNQEITAAEVDIFIGPGYLITIHNGSMYTLTSAVSAAANDPAMRTAWMGNSSGALLHHILEALLRRTFPMLDFISKDMSDIHSRVFKDLNQTMLRKIAQTKRNIIDFRRIMKTHHLILRRLMNSKSPEIVFADSKNYYSDLLEHIENIWDILAIQKETVESLQDTNQAMATNVLNQITKTSTIISGIFFPATLIAFLFSVSEHGIPFEQYAHGFWIVVGLAFAASAGMVYYFKRQQWM
jgi:magnesium transporter